MNNIRWFKSICTGMLLTGMLFFLMYNKLLLIHFTFPSKLFFTRESETVFKKTLTFFFWKNQRWNTENAEILWHNNEEQRILYLSNRWLTFLEEEHILEKKVTVQNICLSKSGKEAYVSFDCSPFSQNASTHQKLMIIEGLLKTLKNPGTTTQTIFFLVNHIPLTDTHLNFSQGWPIQGFLS